MFENKNKVKVESKLVDALNNYTIVPTPTMQSRLEYFYGPYNGYYNVHKSMKFDEIY